MSPSMIVKGNPIPDFKQERILFGLYGLVYIGTINNMNRIIIPSIALNKSNDRVGNYLMISYTGKILHSYKWTELYVDKYVIEQVNQLFSYGKFPLVKDKYPMFEWEPGIPILY